MRLIVSCSIILTFLIQSAFAQMNVRLDYPVSAIEVGETFEIELTITSVPKDTRFLNSEFQFPEALAELSVSDTFLGASLFKRTYNCVALDEDTVSFQFPLVYRTKGNIDSLLSEEITISSLLMTVDESASPTDLKNFIQPELSYFEKLMADYPYALYVLIGLIILGIASLIIWFYTKYQAKQESYNFTEEFVEIEDPLERMDKVFNSLKSDSMDQKSWYTVWSEQLRWYLGKVYGFNGMEYTSNELIGRIQSHSEVKQLIPELSNSMQNADMVKYAGVSVNSEYLEQDYHILEKVFKQTKHAFEPEEQEGEVNS